MRGKEISFFDALLLTGGTAAGLAPHLLNEETS